ncbi:MAG: hypothetical protein SFU87_16240 [Chitinophagaceae bacterium]|nr:hypothetical protein [Chitinophagaceae bacterium]
MQIIKTVVRLLIIVVPFSAGAQSTFLQQGAKDYILLDRLEIKLQKDSLLNFSFLKPFPRKWWVNTLEKVKADVNNNLSRVDEHNLQSALMNNSEWVTGSKESFQSKKSLWNTFYKTQSNFLEVDQEDFFLSVNPVLQLQAMKENNNNEFLYLNTRGLVARGLIAKKLGFQTYLSENQERGPLFLQNRISGFRAVPGAGFYKAFKRTGVDYFDARGYITFNAAKFINFQFGYDRNFIGNGYRSLFLSDYSNNMLFLKINTRVWKLNYNFMVMELTPQYKRGATDSLLSKKYAAIHHISFNAPKWLTFGVFEGIAFGRKDRFDFLYLNPVIFLRPVEQQAGSPDNALIGFDIKANVARRFQFYTQVMLDEFKLSEIRNGTGWWANKWALQLGGKYIDAFGLKNLDLHAEANWVRPFTYSHTDTVANYTHYNQPLAHPLGADFRELVLIARYQPAPKWYIQGRIVSYLQGVDTGGANLGNSIFLPNTTRPFNYGYKIVTGTESKVVNANLYLAYEWEENFFIEASLLLRKITGSSNSTTASLGIRWNMHRREYDY